MIRWLWHFSWSGYSRESYDCQRVDNDDVDGVDDNDKDENTDGDDNDDNDDDDDNDSGHSQVCDTCSIYGEEEEGWEDAIVLDANPDYEDNEENEW